MSHFFCSICPAWARLLVVQAVQDTHFICFCRCLHSCPSRWRGRLGSSLRVWLHFSVMRKAPVDSRTQYSEASATSLGVGNKGHTPDPPQQNPTGWSSEYKWLWKVDGVDEFRLCLWVFMTLRATCWPPWPKLVMPLPIVCDFAVLKPTWYQHLLWYGPRRLRFRSREAAGHQSGSFGVLTDGA